MDNLFDATWKDLHDKSETSRAIAALKPHVIKQKWDTREALKRARPFILDNQALEFILDICQADDQRIKERISMARLPFPVMWIEIDFIHKCNYGSEFGLTTSADDETPAKVAWLLKELPSNPDVWKVQCVHSNNTTGMPSGEMGGGLGVTSTSAVTWYVDTTGSGNFPKKSRIARIIPERVGYQHNDPDREPAEQFLIDAQFSSIRIGEKLKHPIFHNYADYNVEGLPEAFFEFDWNIKEKYKGEIYANQETAKSLTNEIIEARGDLRFLVTALATITKLPVKFSQKKKKGSFRGAGEIKQYLDYSEVTIEIPRKRAKFIRDMERELKKEFAKKKRHEVMGHWRTSDRPIEDWVPYYDEQYKCTRFKRWITAHMRGDASLGFVHHTNYKVTT